MKWLAGVVVSVMAACSSSTMDLGPGGATATTGAGGDGGGGGQPLDAGQHPDASTGSDARGADLAAAADLRARGDAAPLSHDYGSDGPSSVTTASFTVQSPSGGSFTLSGFLPSGNAPCPVVVLSSGLEQPAAAYAPYGHRLASWGIVALLRDDPGVLAQTSTIVADVGYVAGTWLAAQNGSSSSPLHGRVDVTRVGLAGHSRGGQVSLLAAEGPLAGKLRGVFGLDPVDSTMAGGQAARTAIGAIGVPTGFIGETTDGSGSSACAPAADNYTVLYAAAPSPSVAITALGADHTQFEVPASCVLCGLCTAGTAQPAAVLDYSVRYLTTFFARELLGDGSVDAALGSAADVAAGRVTVTSK